MRLESALYSSKEGITAFGQAISVVGDNISNVSTVGFKQSRVEFKDLLADGLGSNPSDAVPSTGDGAQVGRVRQLHVTGVIEPSGRDLDLAIDGGGFLVVEGPDDSRLYTRAGNLQIGEDGLLKDAQGANILGLRTGSTTLGTIDMINLGANATPTTEVTLFGNLASTAEVTAIPTAPGTFRALSGANFSATFSAVDSLGNNSDVSVYFFKQDAGQWVARAYVDGSKVGGQEGVPVQIGNEAELTFGPDGRIPDGGLAAAQITAAPAWSSGAAAGAFTIDLSSFSQVARNNQLAGVSNNGVSAGNIEKYEFSSDGSIFAQLDSGQSVLVGRIQLAQFPNKDGLERIGTSRFTTTNLSGDPEIGNPGDDNRGSIQGASLERSNVDISQQFIDLVLYQRGYQASSQMLTTTSSLVRETLALIR